MLIATPQANGRKGDLFWAALTSLATAVAVKLGEWAVEEARDRAKERRERRARDAQIAGTAVAATEGNPTDEN